jgi:hypothetical protein
MAPLLVWQNPPGTIQYQLQVIPAPNPFTLEPDGPGINLIIGDQTLVAQSRYSFPAPQIGRGPYVLLPGMSYTWRVRTNNSGQALDQDDAGWSAWAARTFRTGEPAAATLAPVSPAEGSGVDSLTPLLHWEDHNPRLFYYEVQVSRDPEFTTDPARATAAVYWELVHGGETSPLNSYRVPAAYPLDAEATYYWRVRPRVQGDGMPVPWGATWSFGTP